MLVAELGDALALALRRDERVGDLLCGDGHRVHSVPLEKRTVTGPRWANSARKTSPGFTGTILCTAPGRIDVARLEARAEAAQLVGQPRHAPCGVAQRGRPGSGVDHLAVARDDDAEQAQVQLLHRPHPPTQHEQAGRGVVRDGVDQLDLPVGDAAVDDLDGRQRTGDRGQRRRGGHAGAGQVALHHESQLGLDPGLDQPRHRDRVAVLDEHLVGEHAEVRLVHPEKGLHGLAGQADLAADDLLARGDTPLDVDRLDRVGVLDVESVVAVGQGGDGFGRAIGLPQLVGEVLMEGGLHIQRVLHPRRRVQPCGTAVPASGNDSWSRARRDADPARGTPSSGKPLAPA